MTGGQEMVRKLETCKWNWPAKTAIPISMCSISGSTRRSDSDYYMLTFSARLPIYRKRKLDPEMTQAVEN